MFILLYANLIGYEDLREPRFSIGSGGVIVFYPLPTDFGTYGDLTYRTASVSQCNYNKAISKIINSSTMSFIEIVYTIRNIYVYIIDVYVLTNLDCDIDYVIPWNIVYILHYYMMIGSKLHIKYSKRVISVLFSFIVDS